jgi:hypothetical protein
MALNFPAPTPGATYTANGITYTYNGTLGAWTAAAGGGGGVTSVTGSNGILVNGNSGSAEAGAVTINFQIDDLTPLP